ncbi:MAG: lamin tail domain-containing protein [Verrucomicrobiota bacterium]
MIPRFLTLAAASLCLLSQSAPAGLVAYWPFNDTATLGRDAAGGSLLTASGGAAHTASGKFGGALQLSGASQFLAGSVNNLPTGNSPYTQSAWIKPTQLGARGIVGWGTYGAARQVNAFRIIDQGNGFRHYWWGADLDATGLTTALNNSQWHHVATTYDGTTRRIYLNGTQVAQDTPGANGATAANFRIGSTNNGEFFVGSIDDVAIYNHGLTATEIQSLASGGSPLAGPLITSFTATPATAFEGDSITLAWTINTANVTGAFRYEIAAGTTVVGSGSEASGSITTTVPDLAGTAQPVTWTLRAIESGGNNVTNAATASVAADPGFPTALSQAGLTAQPGQTLSLTLTGSDPNSGPLTYQIVSPPGRGTLSGGTGPQRTYTPTAGLYGPDQFTFRVSDGKYESAPATVRLTVATPALPPTAVVLDDLTIRPENVPGDFLSLISSPDPNAGDAHVFTLVPGAGSEENANFSISGHQLRAATAFASLTGQPQRLRIRSTDSAGLSVEGQFVLRVQPKPRGVVINEIHYNSADNKVRNSFVELYNDGITTADLSDWRLSGGIDYRFPQGTTMAPGAFLVVAEDPATMKSYFGADALGPWDNAIVIYPDGSQEVTGLSNDGDTIRLRNPSGDITAEVDYGNRSPWPWEGNGEGSSIELIHPGLDPSHGSNWRAAKSSAPTTLATYLPFGSTWRWRRGVQADTGEPGTPFTAWREPSFTEPAEPSPNAQWESAPTPLGFGDNDGNGANGTAENATNLADMTNGTLYFTVYLRRTFTIPAGQLPSAIQVHVRCDDGCIVWINGRYAGAVRPNANIGTGHHFYNSTGVNAPDPVVTEAMPAISAAAVNLREGENTIAIHALNTTPGSSDFSIDAEVRQGVVAGDTASPGARNFKFAESAPPAIRKADHAPSTPSSSDPIVITARITDPQGVASASLAYQLVAPGNFIPSTLPKAVSGGNFVNVTTPLAPNPAFEDSANWTTVAMKDDGTGGDALGGDGIWSATIPPQPHRTLVRYRITAADNHGASARVPYPGDPSLNFACFVYDGVPAYEGTSSADLQKVPVYHFLTRKSDFDQCVAYDLNASQRLTAGPSWNFENWEACFVCNGVVYDHIPYRLKGANGRYTASGTGGVGNGKRAFKFYFHKGYEFDAIDQSGQPYPEKWSTMITENLWENRASFTFSVNEMVSFHLLNELGVPGPRGHWSHFRTILTPAEQATKWAGDFWGLMWVHEDYDRRFLSAHGLKKGNLYKLTRDGVAGLLQFRYQSAFGPSDGSDHDQIHNQLRGTSTPAFIQARVNLDLWCRYHAFCEAIRHYDYWPSGDNNGAWYFYPLYNAANGSKGQMWYLPNDLDATWGPTWNNGHDIVHNALFNDSASTGGDASTNPTLWPRYFNQVREIRRLLWQPDQLNPLIDEFAAVIRPLAKAEFIRWHPTNGAPAATGNYGGLSGPGNTTLNANGETALDNYIAGMKDFAFDANGGGSTWPGGNVGVGGRAAFLDSLGSNLGENATKYPAVPTITYTGPAGYPPGDLRFTTSAFSDPNGDAFAALQWRVAEVNASPTFTPGEKRLLEINASHDSGEITSFSGEYRFPTASCLPGKRYRARVRMKDATGRWSLWSNPAEFTAGPFDPSLFSSQLVISEIMYHAPDPSPAESAAAAALNPPQSWNDDSFDYLELRNISTTTIDLAGFQLTSGVDFVFPQGTAVAPGASILIGANPDAFNARYGPGKPIAGSWDPNDRLNNSGETLTLQFGSLLPPVFSFAYSDDRLPDWPASADGEGSSIVRIRPEDASLDPSLGHNWRASLAPNPGSDDRTRYSDWLAGGSEPDANGNGIPNALEYMLGPNAANSPATSIASLTVNGQTADYMTLSLRLLNGREDFRHTAQFSPSTDTWPFAGTLVSVTDNRDGSRTEIWRAPNPISQGSRLFGRFRFQSQ